VDNLWAYHQLRLTEDSSKVTAINSNSMGSVSVSRVPLWYLFSPTTTAPGEYQARMAHEILQDYYLNGSIEYIDDTVIYGSTVEGFLSILDQILSRMAAFNVRLKPSKCSFGMQSIEFLGHIFDENGVKLSNSCVHGIRDLLEPTSVKGFRSFIGMVNYFRDFIKGLSSHLIPLTQELTKKNAAQKCFQMTPEVRDAFLGSRIFS
jgi:hypothetical protein